VVFRDQAVDFLVVLGIAEVDFILAYPDNWSCVPANLD
jgi:hypothetical protein